MELQKKLGVEISNLFSCPSSFFRKERNKEKTGKVQQDKTNPNTWQKWGNVEEDKKGKYVVGLI